MKKYERPTIEVTALETCPILAGSDPTTVNNEFSEEVQLARELKAFDVWGDEIDEEEY